MAAFNNKDPSSSAVDIEIKININKVEGIDVNQYALKIFHGNCIRSEIVQKEEEKSFTFYGWIDKSKPIYSNLCLLSVEFIEKTMNDIKQDCCRFACVMTLPIIELYKNVEKRSDKSIEFNGIITNRTIDDEEEYNPMLKIKKVKEFGKINGSLNFIKYNVPYIQDSAMISENTIKEKYIYPWWNENIKKLAPGGYVNPVLDTYHVPYFRFLSGNVVPFSYVLYWQNNYFSNFENDYQKSFQFVNIIQALLNASVYMHPEFENMNDFFIQCQNLISTNSIEKNHLQCIEVILNMLNLKSSSEPYIMDKVKITSIGKTIDVDQVSNVCEIYGCDCEDGCKFAYELKRLICDSNWNQIEKTLSGNRIVSLLKDTIVRILNMFTAFTAVMYCEIDKKPLCHVICVLMDNAVASKLTGQRKRNQIDSLDIIKKLRLCFIESTAYSSPFQCDFVYDETKVKLENHIQSFPLLSKSTEIYSSFMRDAQDQSISSFYKYFTNMITIEYLDVLPKIIDFLPITNDKSGILIDDIFDDDKLMHLSLKPRAIADDALNQYLINLIHAQQANYEIVPYDFTFFEKIFKNKSDTVIERGILSCFKFKSNVDSKYQKTFKKGSNSYIRMNVSLIDFLNNNNNILSSIEQIILKYSFIKYFTFRVKNIYAGLSSQSIVINFFFYYDKKNNDFPEENNFKPKSSMRLGRFSK